MAAHLLARYRLGDVVHHGRIDGEALIRLDAPPWLGGRETGDRDPRSGATLLAPVTPSKIVCVGLNYRAHIAESVTVLPDAAEAPREPLLFFKPPSAVVGPDEAIIYPPGVERLDPEAELAVVIGRRAARVTERDAMGHVLGFTALNDVSARNYQRSDGQWARAKGFDTFAPVGPWIATGLDPAGLEVIGRVNGAVRQHGRTADLLFAVPRLIAFVSGIMTLEPGDVIATGTPAGVAPIVPGDVVEIDIPGIGVLRNPVIRREDA